ncbi:MAG: phenylalanine--tRNA ligase subunit beta, partial [Terriglobales bacterium]
MKVLLDWLREFVPITLAPEALAERLSLAGLAVDRADPDWLELDLTSNRPDCLSHYGVAREIAAVTGSELRVLDAPALAAGSAPIAVAIEDARACGRYCALVFEGVQVGDSGLEAARRLQRLDQRPINNVADLTNYTLWEMGHPTHAFDADALLGGQIRVRRARPGETLVTLDGVARKLDPADLVIADASRPVALAGVMGGEETAISARTRRVVLESAWFDPGTVRQSARRHGLHTDASHRFERGADREGAPLAARLIAARMQALGARLAGGMDDVQGTPPLQQPIGLRAGMIERMLGTAVAWADVTRYLLALGCRALSDGRWMAPSWRPDLVREIDLIEEVARLHGYDRFPSRLPAFSESAAPLPTAALRERVRTQLRGRGFAEAVTVSFASEAECRIFAPAAEPVRVLNPLSQEAAILRTSSLPAMLHLLLHNLHHERKDPKLFEIGKLYRLGSDREGGKKDGGTPVETAVLTLGACGAGLDFRQWKGEVEAVLAAFAASPTAAPSSAAFLQPGRAADLGELACLGQLEPPLASQWKLPPETWVAESALAALYAAGPRPIQYQPPPRFP